MVPSIAPVKYSPRREMRCLKLVHSRRGYSADGRSRRALTGGNVAAEVVRVGRTVRKPATPATPAVAALLQHLTAAGFHGSPQHLGLDDTGRQILEYIPGKLADQLRPFDLTELHRLGQMVRHLHDAAETFQSPPDARWQVVIPPDQDQLVCHSDLAPWNLVRAGNRWVFIDWDGAGPGSRDVGPGLCSPRLRPPASWRRSNRGRHPTPLSSRWIWPRGRATPAVARQ